MSETDRATFVCVSCGTLIDMVRLAELCVVGGVNVVAVDALATEVAVCGGCLAAASAVAAAPRDHGDEISDTYIFELLQAEPVPGGLHGAVVVALDQREALLSAVQCCRSVEDVRQWLEPELVSALVLGPVFAWALPNASGDDDVVCATYEPWRKPLATV